jgi:hypothetical protein
MTREEAKKELRKGNKITHKYFLSHEYIILVNGVETFEDGNKVPLGWWDRYDYLKQSWKIYK